LDLGGTGISKSTARRSRLQELLARIRDGEPMQKVLDVAKRRLRLDGVDLGGRLSESSWAFLDTLTEFHPRGFDRASDNDGILVPEHRIANRISACNARRELQRQLPQGVKAKWFVQTIQGKGYRLRADVRIRGRGEAGLQFHDGQKLAVLYPHDGGAEA
jgi:DNA-binding response OmpR family regulator